MTAVESGEINAVVAWHPDRLHRSPKELERFIDIVQSRRVAVQTVTAGEVDLSTATGRAVPDDRRVGAGLVGAKVGAD